MRSPLQLVARAGLWRDRHLFEPEHLPCDYEMRARGIDPQCVPVDYPGFQEHWHREGISKAINEDRLVQIA